MTIIPGTYDPPGIQRRADYGFTLRFIDSESKVMNLTGWTVSAEIWNKARTQQYTTFAVTYDDRVNGTVSIGLTDIQTAALPDIAYYDVLLTNPSGFRQYYLEGTLYISEGYTG